MKIIVTTLLFIFLSASCSRPHKQIKPAGVVTVKSVPVSARLIFSCAENTLTVYGGHGRFYDCNITNGAVIDSFVISALNGKAFDFYKRDSIMYVLETESNKIQCYANGKLQNVYDARLERKMLYAMRAPLYVGKNRELYLCQTNVDVDPFSTNKSETAQFYNNGLLAYCQLADSTIYSLDAHFGKYPAAYLEHMYYNLFPANAPLSDTSCAYIFDAVPELYVYKNGKVAGHKIEGLEANHICEISSVDSLASISYINSITSRSDGYLKLLYDANRQIYYLFQVRAITRETSDELPLFNDQPLTIYAIDSNYWVIGQKEFTNMNAYTYPLVAFIDNGILYLQKQNKKSIELERYEL